MIKVLELGNYVSVAYAGMILAEQGASVTKWHNGRDPILGLHRGQEMWAWINEGKRLLETPIETIEDLHYRSYPHIVIDNFRASTLEGWGINPASLAQKMGCVWVSMRSEYGDVSFDLLAQCRSWMEYAEWVPFYVGDTTGGLWMAFKALAMHAQKQPGHYILGQATCMQKLVEGELVVTPQRDKQSIPWDADEYRFDKVTQEAVIAYKGNVYREPVRNEEWKRAHLWHENGRMCI
jgi:hypothetical protein